MAISQSEIKIAILESLDKNEGVPEIKEINEYNFKILLGEMREEGLINFINFNDKKTKITSKGITYLETFRINHNK